MQPKLNPSKKPGVSGRTIMPITRVTTTIIYIPNIILHVRFEYVNLTFIGRPFSTIYPRFRKR